MYPLFYYRLILHLIYYSIYNCFVFCVPVYASICLSIAKFLSAFIYLPLQLSMFMYRMSVLGRVVGGACGHVFCLWLYTMVYFAAGGHKARGGKRWGGRLHWGMVVAGMGYG